MLQKIFSYRPLADPEGVRDVRPPGVQIISFSCSFWQKVCKIIALPGGTPPQENPRSTTVDQHYKIQTEITDLPKKTEFTDVPAGC